MGILKKIRGKWFVVCCMLLVILIPLVFPRAAQAASTDDVTLTVEQVFTKPEGSQAADSFKYTLTALESGNPMPPGSSGTTFSFTISGNDSVDLGTITYSMTGTYSYEIRQTVETKQAGYTCDMQVYTVRVYVKNTDNGLNADAVVIKENGYKASVIEFANVYAPLSSDPDVMLDPPVKKTVTGNPSEDGTFTFKLEAEEQSSPMPADSTEGVKLMTIVGPGEGDFGTWSYTEAGTYQYTVSEVNKEVDGYTYDTAVYTITDVVKDVNGQLEVERTIINDGKEAVDSYEFVNKYSSGAGSSDKSGKSGTSGSTKRVKTGDNARIELYQVMFLIAGAILIVYVIYRIINRRKRSVNVNYEK